tara:strand:+ start:2840 stop:3274 length:435 start_codon:yes stop_codon:yes gene_type:complete
LVIRPNYSAYYCSSANSGLGNKTRNKSKSALSARLAFFTCAALNKTLQALKKKHDSIGFDKLVIESQIARYFLIFSRIYMSEFESIANTSSYFVGWFTLALINAGLAQGKGRNGLIWFIVSLFVGPIATLLIVVFENLNKQRHF